MMESANVDYNSQDLHLAKEFHQIMWDATIEDDCRNLVRLAVREDLDRLFDWTTVCLVASGARAEAAVVARQSGVVCGLRAAELALTHMDATVQWRTQVEDAATVERGQTLATVTGPARSLLTSERIILNFIGRMSGIATQTRKFVDAIAGSRARLYDTRKTTPAWRRLEKYAVRCGGGHNHRTGLFDGILIKDNHLAFTAAAEGRDHLTPAEAVCRARTLAQELAASDSPRDLLIEVEVDTIEQLEEVLLAGPDLVLLDNMSLVMLSTAVARRNELAAEVELEASGGVTLESVAAIAATGVDRISAGALTHSAVGLDVALDWR
jgi:nicotinate-nucleotide pyrophosphorylase (carboxylating)